MPLSIIPGLRRAAPILLAVLVGLAMAGCTRGWREEPFPGPRAALGDPLPARAVTVQPGDSVYAIARRQGVPTRAIIVSNDLRPPYVLQPGQVLVLPAQRIHEVMPGDTLYGVSRLYGPSVAAIANANGLAPPYGLMVGQRLVIPVDPAPAAVMVAAASPIPPVTTEGGGTMVMGAGPMVPPLGAEPTLDATPGMVSVAPISPPPGTASTGPMAAPDGAPVPPRRPPPPLSSGASLPGASSSGASSSGAAVRPPLAPVAAEARPSEPVPAPPPRAGERFLWPVRGEVIGRFGSSDQGLHNDGINIAVPAGTPIRAADNGVVAYAGNEIQGFGTLVLIKHAGGWMTAYAHAAHLDVRRGDTVRRGQVIARAGRSGSVERPQLHFEIRRDARPVDPLEYLAPPGQV